MPDQQISLEGLPAPVARAIEISFTWLAAFRRPKKTSSPKAHRFPSFPSGKARSSAP